DAATGRLMDISAGPSNSVLSFGYSYDAVGNLASRIDGDETFSETFTYDALNRITSSTLSMNPGTLYKSFNYDPVGNLLLKSDVGNYAYPSPGSPQPHAVTSISRGSINTTFTYDANGNQTAGLGRSIAYSSYNKPANITQGAFVLTFADDVDHQRFRQVV